MTRADPSAPSLLFKEGENCDSPAQAIFTLDPAGRVRDWSEGATAVFGWPAEEIVGEDGDVLFLPKDRRDGIPGQEQALAREHGTVPDRRWHQRKDGGRVLIDGLATVLRGVDGAIAGYLKIGQDVTERHAGAQRDKELAAELHYCVRNSMAVMRSIVRRTADSSETVEDMAAHLQGRIDAFARVQTMLARDVDGGVDLATLIADEMVAHAAKEGDQLTIDGPDIVLRPRAAEAFSLAIHELAANSVKFGALGTRGGTVKVRWSRIRGKQGRQLKFVWEEHGRERPLVAAERVGFGFETLQRTLPCELDAETEIEFLEAGLRFALRMPLGAWTVA